VIKRKWVLASKPGS